MCSVAVEYQKGEEPHLLKMGKHAAATGVKSRMAMSPDGEVFAIATGSDLSLYVVGSGRLQGTIPDIYAGSCVPLCHLMLSNSDV